MRILVTGSRNWTDRNSLHARLGEVWRMGAVLVVGDAAGADTLAAEWWTARGGRVEVHKANRDREGKSAGPNRNQRMVDSGADYALAFPLPGSKGTWDCIRRAIRAGIPVRITHDGECNSSCLLASIRRGNR